MQILSYPIGLLIGLFPIAVDLGESRAPAHVLLDSRPVCEATEHSPGCTVDLGPDPRVHLLELVRTDAAGRITERVARWINRPGIEPEVVASGACDEKRRECEFALTWAHPQKLDPKRLAVLLDGVERWKGTGHHAVIPLAKGARPQIVVCDAEFPDGTRATYTRTLYAFYPEEAQASLLAVPVVPDDPARPPDALASAMRAAGWPLRTVERTDPEVTFVMSPGALDAVKGIVPSAALQNTHVRLPSVDSDAFSNVRVLFPGDSLMTEEIRLSRLGTIRSPVPSRFSRYADAVAAAGYSLGAAPRCRGVVLVLSGFDRPNASSFSAAQARAYLSEAMVPLVVWRVGNVEAPEWPDGPRLATKGDLLEALKKLRSQIDRQRIVWIEGPRDLRYVGRWLAPGVAVAGRDVPLVSIPSPSSEGVAAREPLASVGPEGGPAHAFASSSGGALVFAATNAGVFARREGSARWERRSSGLPPVAVRSLAVVGAEGAVVAATDAGLFRSGDAGAHWFRAAGSIGRERLASVAGDPALPRLLIAGGEGSGVWRSDDGGASWLATAMDHGDFRALAVDPRTHAVLAASEGGVFRSENRGLAWTALPGPPSRVLALVIEPGGRILAATAGGGVFASADSGLTWTKTSLVRAFVTSLAAAAHVPGHLLAGSPDGIYASADAGRSWRLARVGPVEAVSSVASGVSLAGSVGGVLRREGSAAAWRPFDAGLAAAAVHSVGRLPGPDGALLAATSVGLLRRAGAEWERVPGMPEGIVAYALSPVSSGAALLVGTAGSIARNDGTDWVFHSTYDAFGFASDETHPGRSLAATRGGVLRTEDGGRTWSVSAGGLEKTFALQLSSDRAEPPAYYAATAGGGVFRSLDGGRSWKPGGTELTRRVVRSVVVDPTGEIYAGTDSGVFASPDRGASWVPRDEGLPRAPVYALVADAAASGTLYAGTAEGLFCTADGGATWRLWPADRGIGAPVTSLFLDRERAALVVGSFGAGVFVVPLPPPSPR